MRGMGVSAATGATLLALVAVARAETTVGAADTDVSQNGRFQMTPAPDGFMRLDTRTGAVSVCTLSGGSAACRAAADERSALMNEIDRLAKRNAQLEPGGAATRPGPLLGRAPDREDMRKAMDFAEDFMRRMMRILRDDTEPRPGDKT